MLVAALTGTLAGLLAAGVVAAVDDEPDSNSAAPSSGGSDQTSDSGTPPLAERPPESVAGVADRVVPSTAFIEVTTGGGSGAGSGIVLDKDGHILTNNHVVALGGSGSAAIKVTLPNGESSTATIVGRVPSMDLAVVKVDAPADALVPAQLGDSDALVPGDPVIAVGAPLGLQGTVTSGIVSALNRPVTVGGGNENTIFSAIQTDAAINPGNSGGPLANGNGEVVGVNSAIATLGTTFGGESGSIGVGFSIPMNQAKRVANELIETGNATRATLGVTVPADESGTDGAQVESVQPGSPADQAGLREGDVIVEFAGIRIPNGASLIAQVRAQDPGESVELVYERDGKESTVTVTLDSAPAE